MRFDQRGHVSAEEGVRSYLHRQRSSSALKMYPESKFSLACITWSLLFFGSWRNKRTDIWRTEVTSNGKKCFCYEQLFEEQSCRIRTFAWRFLQNCVAICVFWPTNRRTYKKKWHSRHTMTCFRFLTMKYMIWTNKVPTMTLQHKKKRAIFRP